MSHEPLLVGVDAGGTSTRALLTDASGRCLGYGTAGRGNPISAGADLAADGVLAAVRAALAPSGAALADVSVIVPAMAGMRASGGSGWLMDRLVAEGFAGTLRFESDLLATYFSASASDSGYALVSGTGACVIRVQQGRIVDAGDGLGWLLGDRGSGFWIGREIAQAAVQDLDGTGPATALTDRVLTHCGVSPDAAVRDGRRHDLEELVGHLYATPPIALAGLAPYAFDEDDAVARRILVAAGEHLADTLTAVLAGPGPVVIGGSVLGRSGALREAFVARLGDALEGLELKSVDDGAIGAAVLAVRVAGGAADEATLATLTRTVSAFR